MRYLTSVETAKLVRKALKKEFPGQKFYVQGKSSVHVSWIDGPTEKQVRNVTGVYEGKAFDSSIDMQFSYSAWLLPDGTATIAGTPGSSRSMGYTQPFDTEKPHPDAERVMFCTYVFASRDTSRALVERVVAEVCKETGWDTPEIKDDTAYMSASKTIPAAYIVRDFREQNQWRIFNERLGNTSG